MTKFRLILFFVTNAAIAWGIWLGEVFWIKGWHGLAWLDGFNWAAIPACLLLAVSTAFATRTGAGSSRYLVYIGVTSAAALGAFFIARNLAFEVFSNGVYFGPRLPVLALFLVAWFLFPATHTVAAKIWLRTQGVWPATLAAFAFVIAIPISFLTIRLVPAPNGSVDPIHAFKMGYPIFWMIVLVPLAIMLSQRRELSPIEQP